FGAISKSTMDENTELMAPHDLNFTDSKQAKQFESKLKQADIDVTKDYKEVVRGDILKDQVFQKSNMGRMDSLFVTSFLGLAFLVAAGCIIYIKQMDETEDEIPSFCILRKIGYTHQDMLKGLGLKVIFNFGLPLVVSLMHAYFAAKAFMGLYNATS